MDKDCLLRQLNINNMLLTEQAQFDIYVRENWRMVFA